MKKQYLLFGAILLIAFSSTSCTVHPFTYANAQSGSQVASLGGSLLTKTKGESAYLEKGDLKMGYNMQGKSETSVPNTLIWGSALSSIAGDVANSVNAATASKEAMNATNAATQVELAKEATKAAEAAAVVVP